MTNNEEKIEANVMMRKYLRWFVFPMLNNFQTICMVLGCIS